MNLCFIFNYVYIHFINLVNHILIPHIIKVEIDNWPLVDNDKDWQEGKQIITQ